MVLSTPNVIEQMIEETVGNVEESDKRAFAFDETSRSVLARLHERELLDKSIVFDSVARVLVQKPFHHYNRIRCLIDYQPVILQEAQLLFE